MKYNGVNFTPNQELILEVLAARYRLGEDQWTFHKRFKKNILQLEELDLIIMSNGIVEDTVRASLTSNGRELMLSSNYTLPSKRTI